MMSVQTCDLCHRAATHFFSEASCTVGGNSSKESNSTSVALCAYHAAEHGQLRVKRQLEQILETMGKRAGLAKPVDGISLTVTGPTQTAMESVAVALTELCGGESLIRSPDEVVEEILKFIPVESAEAARKSLGSEAAWEVRWNSDTSTSILDRWQTGGWSQRLYALITSRGCELKGWSVSRPPVP